jgi:ABC-type bacteriocin/lantibiotic exporter with double-glycine peptidase domain
MPDGYRTTVGERGIRLSGGQRQRIGIARAVYDRPGLIVLDEPTSSLDEETERVFFKMLALLQGKTTFVIITHKLAMLDHVDHVLLLEENGGVVTARFMDPKSALSLKRKRVFEE